MNTLCKRSVTPAWGWAGVFFLVCIVVARCEDRQRFANTSPERTFEESFTLHRARMGLTNVNGIAYLAVTRSDLYENCRDLRVGETKMAVGTLAVGVSGPRVTEAHVYIDTGNAPIRVAEAPGKILNLKIGSYTLTNAPMPAMTPFADPRVQAVGIGSITNFGSMRLREVDIRVRTPGIEIVPE